MVYCSLFKVALSQSEVEVGGEGEVMQHRSLLTKLFLCLSIIMESELPRTAQKASESLYS